jgi:cell division protein DivIC
MSEQRNSSPISLTQVFRAATLAFAVFILVVLAQRLTTSAVLWRQTHELQAEIDAGRAETQRLEQRKLYVQTNEYVESVARHDMKMGKPGEVSVLPVPAATGQATPGGAARIPGR